MFSEILQRDFESVTICARRDRQSAAAVQKIKGALLETHPQLAAFKDTSILVTEDGQQDLVVQIRFQRMQIRHNLARLSKGEPAIELQSVSRTGNARMFFVCHVLCHSERKSCPERSRMGRRISCCFIAGTRKR